MTRMPDDPPSLQPAEELRLLQQGDDFEDELEREWLKEYGDNPPSLPRAS